MKVTPTWVTGLQWTLWFIIMTVVMRWISRSRVAASGDGKVLSYPKALMIIGAIGQMFFIACAIGSAVSRGKDDPVWLPAAFLGFSCLSLPLIVTYFRTRYELEPGGMRYQSLLRAPSAIRWADVTKVSYSRGGGWFSVTTRGGTVVRLSAMLIGLPEFARALLAEVPASAIDAAAHPLIEQTAAGSPPRLW